MLVAGDDVVDTAGDSSFEELATVGISLDCCDVYRENKASALGLDPEAVHCWIDDLREIADRFDFLLDIAFVQPEAVRIFEERLTKLGERRDRDDDLILAAESLHDELVWGTGRDDTRSKYIHDIFR